MLPSRALNALEYGNGWELIYLHPKKDTRPDISVCCMRFDVKICIYLRTKREYILWITLGFEVYGILWEIIALQK